MDKESKSNQHPRVNASFLSILTHGWTYPIFFKGLRKDLEEDDLYEPLTEHSSRFLGDRLEAAWNVQLSRSNPSLWRAIINVFWFEFTIHGVLLLFIQMVLQMSQPLALGKLITYFSYSETSVTRDEALTYAGVLAGGVFLNAIFWHIYMLGLLHLGMKLRVACCSLVYRKSLKLSQRALGETSAGQLTNLLSNDANRFDYAVMDVHTLWVGPVQTAVTVYLLYIQVGVSAVVGILFILGLIPLEFYLGKLTSKFRLETTQSTDQRVRIMNEIISGIQVIKLYAWEKSFAKVIASVRRKELQHIRSSAFIRSLSHSLSFFANRFAIYLSILTYVIMGNVPTAEYVFVVTSFYGVLRDVMTVYFPQGILQVSEVRVSVKRLQQFLLREEINPIRDEPRTDSYEIGITLDGISARWCALTEDVLTNINLKLKQGQLLVVAGPVGSGKSSLLQVLLGELAALKGLVNINGAVSYSDQNPWLFAGTVRENILFGQPMNSERYKEVVNICALERDFSYFSNGDNTLVGERGVLLSGGQKARINLARAVYKNADIYLLDDPLSAVDVQVGRQLFEKCITQFLKNKCTILVTHQLQYLRHSDNVILLDKGSVIVSGVYQQLLASRSKFTRELQQITDLQADETPKVEQCENVGPSAELKEVRSTGNLSCDVYKFYVKSGGGYLAALGVFLVFALAQFCYSASDYFITYWVNFEQYLLEANTTNPPGLANEYIFAEENTFIYIFSGLIAGTVIFAILQNFSTLIFCLRASFKLHQKMFSSIVNATMKFFNDNPSGRILNRFSNDIGIVDEALPVILTLCISMALIFVGIVVLVSYINPWLLLQILAMMALFYFLRIIYMSTSRDVKRLLGVTRSPIFTHINETLQGLSTIRAFGAQDVLKNEFDKRQNLNSSAYYLFIGCDRAFAFLLDIICSVFIATVAFSFFYFKVEKYSGNVGLAITQSVKLTVLIQWGIRQWSDLENQLTSVERILEFIKLKSEENNKEPLTSTWPITGNITFQDVSLKYSEDGPLVLKNVNFKIGSKQKIGIVGRTGAGKSSLVTALFQLHNTSGKIFIDDLDVEKIPRQNLRSSISIIPQEPVLFSGTIRKNLDPFDEYSDIELWNSLEETELKNVVFDLESGLLSEIQEGGNNFSIGQRQLFCLARAIVRKNKILVMDEATANVDSHTDSLIQKTLRKKFSDCTVLTVAHRLHTIMDSDKVLVMDAGTVLEFDHPHVLLQNKDGAFFDMVRRTGEDMMERLTNIAQKNYENTHVGTNT